MDDVDSLGCFLNSLYQVYVLGAMLRVRQLLQRGVLPRPLLLARATSSSAPGGVKGSAGEGGAEVSFTPAAAHNLSLDKATRDYLQSVKDIEACAWVT